MQREPQSRWMPWVHRIGYVTTIVVLLTTAFVGVVLIRERLASGSPTPFPPAGAITHYRVHPGPLLEYGRFGSQAWRILQRSPAPASDGMRFVAMTADGDSYAVVLADPDGRSASAAALLVFPGNGRVPVTRHRFTIPADAYHNLVGSIDRLFDSWSKDEASLCLDRSTYAFERTAAARTTSSIGDCNLHYSALGLLVLTTIRPYLSGVTLPGDDDDWTLPSQTDD